MSDCEAGGTVDIFRRFDDVVQYLERHKQGGQDHGDCFSCQLLIDVKRWRAEIDRLKKECADRADCEKHLLEDINKADEEIEALTKERDRLLEEVHKCQGMANEINILVKENNELKERLKGIEEFKKSAFHLSMYVLQSDLYKDADVKDEVDFILLTTNQEGM